MNFPKFKENLLSRLPDWIDERINHLVANNPAMTVVSAYLKRGAHNYLSQNHERISTAIDRAQLFLCDEKGNVNLNTVFDDLVEMFKALPPYPFDLGFIHGTIGKGEIRISLPDNILCTIFFGNIQSISINSEDLLAFKKYINSKNI